MRISVSLLLIIMTLPLHSAQSNENTNSIITNSQTSTWNIRESWLWGKPFLNIFCLPIGFVSYDYVDSFQKKSHGQSDYFYRGLPVPSKVLNKNETNRVLVPRSPYAMYTGLSLSSDYYDMALFGVPQRLKLHFLLSQHTKDIAVEYMLPEIAQKPWLLALQAYYTVYDNIVSDTNFGEGLYPGFTTSSAGMFARTGVYFFGSLSADVGVTVSLYQYRQTDTQYASTNGAQSIPMASLLTIFKQEGNRFYWESPWFVSFAPEFNITYDSRDNYMHPNSGIKLGLDASLSFGACSQLYIHAQFMWAIPIGVSSLLLKSSFQTLLPNPFAQGQSNLNEDRLFTRFDVRGWSYANYVDFGFLGDLLWDLFPGYKLITASGNTMFLISLEYQMPIITDVLGTYCFIDSGQSVYAPGRLVVSGDLRDMRFSAGIGLRLLMPFFPFDIALVKRFVFNGSVFSDSADEYGAYFLGNFTPMFDWPFLGRGWSLVFSVTRAF